MADPLGLIGSSGNVQGPRTPMQPQTPAGGRGQDPRGPSFKDVLLENMHQVNRLQKEADKAIEDLHTGRREDVEGVLLATQKADTAFRMLLAVRNKMHQAYEEIKQMRV